MTPPERRPENRLLGVLMVLAATGVFSTSDVISKVLVGDLSPYQAAWLRNVFIVLFTLPIAFLRLGRGAMATTRPGMQILRAVVMLGSSLTFMVGLSHMPLGDVAAINFIWPIMVTALSVPLLGERVGVRRWLAAAFGFLGVLLVVKPGGGAFQVAALYPFASAVLWALCNIITRGMSTTERPETTLAWSAVIGLVLMSFVAPFVWRPLTLHEIGMATLIAALSSTAHALYVVALNRTRASVIAPFSYMQLVWSMLLGVMVFSERPDALTILGAAMIVASGLYTAHRERVRKGVD